ncbi:hypothetical protein VKT23_017979 [Stygiomarasmius scandens]|uniref:Uncharacterized protein n=1 Tax=Marasmiellus scandens TaxID=2682957 RepID=A0ABR1IQZ0_9AGAR
MVSVDRLYKGGHFGCPTERQDNDGGASSYPEDPLHLGSLAMNPSATRSPMRECYSHTKLPSLPNKSNNLRVITEKHTTFLKAVLTASLV